VLAVGLTGGIGSGKSTVADLLVERGAVLIDADQIAREVVAPGAPAHRQLVERFGEGVLAPDGTLDRPALAKVAFADPESLAALNAITHPAIGAEMLARRQALADRDVVGLLAIPLLTSAHRQTVGLDGVVVVDCPVEVAVDRLVEYRGMEPADARARVAAQISRHERVEGADYVVDNGGDLAHLRSEVDRLWGALEERRRQVRSAEVS
jgi:dephospho-CoA kinase